jgi:hypothetical protein
MTRRSAHSLKKLRTSPNNASVSWPVPTQGPRLSQKCPYTFQELPAHTKAVLKHSCNSSTILHCQSYLLNHRSPLKNNPYIGSPAFTVRLRPLLPLQPAAPCLSLALPRLHHKSSQLPPLQALTTSYRHPHLLRFHVRYRSLPCLRLF